LHVRPGVDVERWALEEARRIVLDAVGEQDIDVYLFGSMARGDAHTSSDVDIALDGHGAPVARDWLEQLRERLDSSLIPFHVEVVDLGEASPALRRIVFEEGIPWTP